MIPFAILIAMLVSAHLIIHNGLRAENKIAEDRWAAWAEQHPDAAVLAEMRLHS